MARETGLEPATSGVTGRTQINKIKRDPKTVIKKSLAISVDVVGGFGTVATVILMRFRMVVLARRHLLLTGK
jgi:hypothetical protein